MSGSEDMGVSGSIKCVILRPCSVGKCKNEIFGRHLADLWVGWFVVSSGHQPFRRYASRG